MGPGMIGLFFVAIGLAAIAVAAFAWKPRKDVWSILATLTLLVIGTFYVFEGIRMPSDPVLQIDIGNLFELVAGAVAVGKAVNWIVTRTEIYKTVIGALKAVPEIKNSVSNIEAKVKEKG